MTRLLRIELRRSVALVLFVATAVGGTAMMFNDTEQWVGRWSGLAVYLRTALVVLVPIVLAAAAWQGGRERRRRMDELLSTVPRPRPQLVLVRWGVVSAGVVAGCVVVWLVCAAFVAPVATYSGGGWWWLTLVAVVAVAAAAAVGLTLGQVLPWRLAAPVIGVAGYAGIGLLSFAGDSGRMWLSPVLPSHVVGEILPASASALQAAWFAGLGVSALTLAGARKRKVVAAPAAMTLAIGAVIVVGPGDERWTEDAAAAEQVCTGDVVDVCATRQMGFLLDDFVAATGETVQRLSRVPGAPRRILVNANSEARWSASDPVRIGLERYVDWRGGLSMTDAWGYRLRDELATAVLPPTQGCADWPAPDRDLAVVSVVAQLWAGATGDAAGADAEVLARYQRFADRPEAAQARWMQRYYEAARNCDAAALPALKRDLA
ncbi:hypothetical protein CLV30_13125 [Haloactinopolyspora alba]|uniref:ABC-type transport system involved in multi-copper enzyme maturation permease subunit n=1 Tax=Haloactinopolyspora alba TaxID=648780 RepID=A0A2P8D713_9ACTN|nr:hypothetical protein [Haloactinopolyspora alba]PSK92998.1 hypothetical protein CLV30_13125 [Haloactinopolyspora alba]